MVLRMRQWLCRWVTTIRVLGVPVMPPVSGTPVEGSGITVREVGRAFTGLIQNGMTAMNAIEMSQ